VLNPFEQIKNLGGFTWLRFSFRRIEQSLATFPLETKRYYLRPRCARRRVQLRRGTSDILVFSQVFACRQYGCLDGLRSPKLIVDCGANVGYSAVYLLSQFPGAFLIAIEPDPGNFETLETNLLPFKKRVRLINAGVWTTPSGLLISNPSGDGLEWSRRVRPCEAGEAAQIRGITLDKVLKESGFERISILKVDIEGTEEEIFSRNYENWISKTDNLAIELHGSRAYEIFYKAISPLHPRITHHAELTFCTFVREAINLEGLTKE
jgi:FkbM family methyltransferase